MRVLAVGFLLAVAFPCWAQTKPSAQTVKVKIEATELDKRLLLDKLNRHGLDHGLKFELADQDYNYRIEFGTFQHRSTGATQATGAVHFSGTQVKVYDRKGRSLFEFQRDTRFTDTGATNAAAKEIIKRLIRWQLEQAKEKSK